MTNLEKIKNMTAEEMANFLDKFHECDICSVRRVCCKWDETIEPCAVYIKKWLESEVDND